jgi:hypothetical protein
MKTEDKTAKGDKKCLNCRKPKRDHIHGFRYNMYYCHASMEASPWGTFRTFKVDKFGCRI